MNKIHKHPPKVEIDFTDAQLTGSGGLHFVAQMAHHLGLPRLLQSGMHVKRRRRGCDDSDTLMGLILSLASGNGALQDLDAFRRDTATLAITGLEQAPASRRLGEYLRRCTRSDVEAMLAVARTVSAEIIADACAREIEVRGYIPVFIDGSEIEITGQYYEEAHRGYSGRLQYWLHGVFVGGVWASARLCPGGVAVVADWREQLEHDVLPALSRIDVSRLREEHPDAPVWVSADNAYYRKDCADYFHKCGWEYSISVTHGVYKRPILQKAGKLDASKWEEIGGREEAAMVHYKPAEWADEQSYVIIRSHWDGQQQLLFPRHTVICVSRADLPLRELVARHRHKQGMENEFKGPLDALDLHHPPCQQFLANQIFYICGQLAHTLLRAVQYRFLPRKESHRTIRTLIHLLVRTVARVVHTGRKTRLLFVRSAWRLDWIHYAACQLE